MYRPSFDQFLPTLAVSYIHSYKLGNCTKPWSEYIDISHQAYFFVNEVLFVFVNVGRLACKLFEQMRREAAALQIQKNYRCYIARKSYLALKTSAVVLQTGLRVMSARTVYRLKKQTKAAICIQVPFLFQKVYSFN